MEWIAKYWIEAGFGVIVAALGWCYRRLARRVKAEIADQAALKNGVQALLRDRIIQAHGHYMERGTIPIYGMENVFSMYGAYHALGGNGTVTKLVEGLKKLPTE